jgi:hypothetical protein
MEVTVDGSRYWSVFLSSPDNSFSGIEMFCAARGAQPKLVARLSIEKDQMFFRTFGGDIPLSCANQMIWELKARYFNDHRFAPTVTHSEFINRADLGSAPLSAILSKYLRVLVAAKQCPPASEILLFEADPSRSADKFGRIIVKHVELRSVGDYNDRFESQLRSGVGDIWIQNCGILSTKMILKVQSSAVVNLEPTQLKLTFVGPSVPIREQSWDAHVEIKFE